MDASLAATLPSLAAGERLAIVNLRGSLAPVTRGHILTLTTSRDLLLGGTTPAGSYHGVIGCATLNSDGHVSAKVRAKGLGDVPLRLDERIKLVELAATDHPWLFVAKSGGAAVKAAVSAARPDLVVDYFEVNGADDVMKYRKWNWGGVKLITMNRPGSTAQLTAALAADGVSESADFIIGPELPDISSTAARAAARRGDRAVLITLLHDNVADAMLAREAALSGGAVPTGAATGAAAVAAPTAAAPVASAPPPPSVEADAGGGLSAGTLMIVHRPSGIATLLRKIATTRRSGDVWIDSGGSSVASGERVEVVRQEYSVPDSVHEPRTLFYWARSTTSGEEGYINACYVVKKMMIVRRCGAATKSQQTTLLRKVATTSRSGDVWTGGSVYPGERVAVLHDEMSSTAGTSLFIWIRSTCSGEEGFINAKHVVDLQTG